MGWCSRGGGVCVWGRVPLPEEEAAAAESMDESSASASSAERLPDPNTGRMEKVTETEAAWISITSIRLAVTPVGAAPLSHGSAQCRQRLALRV